MRSHCFAARPLRHLLHIALCILCLLTPKALAAPEPFLGSTFAQESWSFLPAVGEDPQKIGAILAVKDPDEVIGDNITVILFIREDDGWTGWAWFAETMPNAIGAAVVSLNPHADSEEIADLIGGLEIAVEYDTFNPHDPKATRSLMGVGVLADDPLSTQTADGYEGVLLARSLTRQGHRAADLDLDLSVIGLQEALPIATYLSAIAKGTEFALVHPNASHEEAAMAMFRAMDEINPLRKHLVASTPEAHPRIHLIRVGSRVWMLGECWFDHYLQRARAGLRD
ncbi:MAG: hypothetical protein ACNA8P_03985 [Phycisphaerales bacterium]